MTDVTFRSTIIEWRGPAPFYYAPIPDEHVEAIRQAARLVSYGWGAVPVSCTIGEVEFTTSLFPKNGTYLLPLKDAVRRRCAITVGDAVDIELAIKPR